MVTSLPPSRRQVRVVELFGLPGAGKTTLTDRLNLPQDASRRQDLSRGLRSLSPSQLLKVSFRTLTDWRWLLALAKLVVATPIWRPESLHRLVRIAAYKTWIASQEGLVVLDQGPLQGLWSIFYTEGVSAPPTEALSRVVEQLYRDVEVTIVEISVNPELSARRIDARTAGNSRLDELPQAVALRRLLQVKRLPAALIEAAETGGLRVVRLSGQDDLADSAARLGEVVDEVAGGEAVSPC